MKASCAALLLSSAATGTAWAGLLDSPAGGTLPGTISPVGGIVVDIVGLNGTRLMTVVDAATLYNGWLETSQTTIGVASGFTSSLINSLGGGISSASFRITLYNGDNTYDSFDFNDNYLYVNGNSMGNFSTVATTQTSGTAYGVYFDNYSLNSGTSYFISVTGTTAVSSTTGFGANLDTGYFSVTGTSALSNLYAALKTGTLTFSMYDNDTTPVDNYVNFKYAYAGGSGSPFNGGPYEYVGYLPGINSPTLVLSNTWNTPTTLDYVAQYNTITTEDCTINSLTFTPGSTLTLSGTLTVSSGTISTQSGGSSTISGGYLAGPGSLLFDTAGNQSVSSSIVGNGFLIKSGSATLILTGANLFSGVASIHEGDLVIGNGSSGSLNNAALINVMSTGTLTFNMVADAINTPSILNSGVVQVAGSNTLNISGVINGTGSFYQNGTGTTVLAAANTYTGATVVNAGTLWIGNGTTGSIASTSDLSVGAGAALVLASNDSSLWAHSISNNGTVVFQGPANSYAYTGDISGSGGIVKAGNNTLTLSVPQTYTGLTLVAGGTLIFGAENILSNQSVLQINSGATADMTGFSQSMAGLAGAGTIVTGTNTVLTLGANGSSSTFSGLISGSGSLVKSGAGTVDLAGVENATGGITVESGTLVVSGAATGDVTIDSNAKLLVTGTVGGDADVNGYLIVNGTFGGNVNVAGYLGGSGMILGNVTNQSVVSPGNSPGILTISGNYTQSSAGALYIQIASPTSYDRLVVGGTASLDGALVLTSSRQIRTEYTILTAGAGITGTFSSIQADSFLKFAVAYSADSITLEPYYRYLSIVPGLTSNEYAVAKTLDAMMDTRGFYEHDKLIALGDYLNALPDKSLPAAFEMIVPTDYVILPDATFSLAQVQTNNLELRMEQIRTDYADFCTSVDAGRTTNDGTHYIDAQGRDITPTPIDRAWSFFMNGSGDFVSDKASTMYDNGKYTTGGVSAGADYRWDSYDIPCAAGLTLGYANTSLTGRGDGKSDIDNGDLTGYVTAFKNGFFANGILGGGVTNYDLKRESLDGMARGSTSGINLNAALGGGYSYTACGFSAGPIASLRYTGVQIDGFSERGSMAPLDIHQQSKNSLKSTMGFQVSYEFPVETVLIKPHARVQWRHEYANDSRDVSANFQDGGEFTVNGSSLGSDSMLLDLGATVRFTPLLSAYAYYLGDLGSSNYTSNAVIGGMQFSF